MTHGMSKTPRPISNVREGCSRKCITVTLACIFFSSIVLCIIFWCTDIFQSVISSNMVLRNNTSMFEWWTQPPIRAIYKIRIFNYTNVKEFESGDASKLKVEEVGPYIYRETLLRVNQVMHPNGSITFQEHRSYHWEGGSPENETIMTPNISLLAAMAFMRDTNFFIQLGFTTLLAQMKLKTFINVSAGEFLWGYDDKLFNMVKSYISLPFDNIGMLAFKNGISQHSMTMQTGRDDHTKIGMIEKINGQGSRHVWNDEECDRVHGTEGFMFPSDMYLKPNATLDVYVVDMCRSLKLESGGNGLSFGIPTLKFKPATDSFSYNEPKNSCFCQKGSRKDGNEKICPPKGVFNSSACNNNMPMMASLPHFYGGDPILRSKIEGLDPQAELHDSYIELHPRLGVLIGGSSKIQINIEARKALGIPYLGNLQDGQILPLIWIETTVDDIPPSMLSLFKHAYFTLGAIEIFLQWGSLLSMLMSMLAMMYIMGKSRNERHAALKRNTSGQDKLLEGNNYI